MKKLIALVSSILLFSTQAYAVSDVDLTYKYFTRSLNTQDKVCVMASKDINDGKQVFVNLGKFYQDIVYTNMAQHSPNVVAGSVTDINMAQSFVSANNCNILVFPQVSKIGQINNVRKQLVLNFLVYDNQMKLLDNVVFTALANTYDEFYDSKNNTLEKELTIFVHKLYTVK